MTQARAQELIDNARGPDGPFRVQIYGADHFDDEYLFDLPMTAIGASNDDGLSADFDLEVIRWKLDEDDNFFDDDEIYALVTLSQWVPYGETFFYVSNELSHEY